MHWEPLGRCGILCLLTCIGQSKSSGQFLSQWMEEVYLHTAGPGQDEEVRNWDQVIPLIIVRVVQVGRSRGHLTGEPGSRLTISEIKVGVIV